MEHSCPTPKKRKVDIMRDTDDVFRTSPSPLSVAVGAAIKHIRRQRGLTQEELAKLTHFSRGSIANIETGFHRMLLDDFLSIALILRVDPEKLIRPDEIMKESFAPFAGRRSLGRERPHAPSPSR